MELSKKWYDGAVYSKREYMFPHGKVVSRILIFVAIPFLIGIFFLLFFPAIFQLFSYLHFFLLEKNSIGAQLVEKNSIGAQLVVGEDINKYTQIHWADPKMEQEYPERGLTFRYESGNATTIVVDILDLENTKKQSISFPRGEVRGTIKWLDNGFFLHGVEDVPGSWKEVDRDYFYDLEKKEKRLIQNDGQEKCKGKDEEWLLHPKNRNYLLETYCLSIAYDPGGGNSCIQWGVSLITSKKSTNILSFYHSFRQQLRIGWDDDNFYVKTRKSDVDWGAGEQGLVQERMNVDKADSSDRLYIILLENLKNL